MVCRSGVNDNSLIVIVVGDLSSSSTKRSYDRTTNGRSCGRHDSDRPTGPASTLKGESSINSVVFQTFVGLHYHFNRDLFVRVSQAIAGPTDARTYANVQQPRARLLHISR